MIKKIKNSKRDIQNSIHVVVGRLAAAVIELIKFKHFEINNNTTWSTMQLYADHTL